jgi:hypothetical protein
LVGCCGRALRLGFYFHYSPLFPDSFYQGKTITIIHGRAPGGSGDLRVRAVVPFLQKYIPGNPKLRARIYGRRRRTQGGQFCLSRRRAPMA